LGGRIDARDCPETGGHGTGPKHLASPPLLGTARGYFTVLVAAWLVTPTAGGGRAGVGRTRETDARDDDGRKDRNGAAGQRERGARTDRGSAPCGRTSARARER